MNAKLDNEGLVVISIPPGIIQGFDLRGFMEGQVEFKEPTIESLKVLGAFGAYANPSSFHHPEIRRLRHNLWKYMEGVLTIIHPGKYLQCLPDRFSCRNPGATQTAESWHKDASVPYTRLADRGIVAVYGGWVNLDATQQQQFIYAPGTQTCEGGTHGFQPIPNGEEKNACEANKKVAIIPPGHAVLFNELISHKVAASSSKVRSYRMYWKFVISDQPLNIFGSGGGAGEDQMEIWLNNFSPLPYHEKENGAFQFPPMFSSNHYSRVQMLDQFGASLKTPFTQIMGEKLLSAGHVWPKMVLPPLTVAATTPGFEDLGTAFPAYTPAERKMFKPKRLPDVIDLTGDGLRKKKRS